MEIGGRLPSGAQTLNSQVGDATGRAKDRDLTARKTEFAHAMQVDTQIATRAMRHTTEANRTQAVKGAKLAKRKKSSSAYSQPDEEEMGVAADAAMSQGGLDAKKIYEMQCAVFGQFMSNRQGDMKESDEEE